MNFRFIRRTKELHLDGQCTSGRRVANERLSVAVRGVGLDGRAVDDERSPEQRPQSRRREVG